MAHLHVGDPRLLSKLFALALNSMSFFLLRIRLLLAWLVIAALPIQGIAATSMLSCEKSAHSTVSMRASELARAAHRHGADGDHALSPSDGDVSTQAEPSAKLIGDKLDGAKDRAGLVKVGHECPIFTLCCNLVALSEMPIVSLAGDSSEAPPFQGPVRVSTRHAPIPDKPPRA